MTGVQTCALPIFPWVKKNLPNGKNESSVSKTFETKNTLFFSLSNNLITNYSIEQSTTKNRPITNFNFENLPETVSGIAFRLTVNRSGRVFDDTVQLTYNGELIGENKCSRTVDPIQLYGDSTDLWTVENINDIIQDPSFGITIRMKSHPDWPHKTTPILKGLELQIY